ncbi:MAG: molybdopterin oxidoreductase family protein [Steroidobacteraceae bacterium]|jgi:anaerobic selenocysteine-containing dehydrogenase|nr:molybdopterin oxidoreductase family protein [Steroidobacteraceae bacterium]
MNQRAQERTHFGTCPLCEAMCGIEIRTEGSRILSIRGDGADPFSRGHICPKAVALKDVHEDPDRLRAPVRRVGDRWIPVSWEEALAEVASRLAEIQSRHGRDAVATYFGNPTVHSYSALLAGARFGRTLGSRNRFSATSVDQLPHHVAVTHLYGHPLLLPIPDLDRTRLLLVIGANPVVSNGSLMTAPDVARRLKDLRARGGTLIVVDPRRTETAQLADTHHFIRPGRDAWLLLGLLQVIFEEELARPGRLAAFTEGIDTVRRLVRPFEPGRVARATGIAAEDVVALARRLAAAESAAVYGRMGVSVQPFGALCQWLIQVLNVVTGNLDRPGGVMFTRPAVDFVAYAGRGIDASREPRRTRVRGLPGFGGEFPVAALAEEIETPGPGQIRALLTSAGNPVLSTPNGRRLERALASLEFMAAVDFYINETTRHAQIILPPTFALERDHYDLVFHALAIRNTAKYARPLFEPSPGALHDWQIFAGLTRRLEALDRARRPPLRQRLADRWLTPRRTLALGLRFGPYGSGMRPWRRGLSLRQLEEQPHGLDLGPLEPCLPSRLRIRGKRIQLAPPAITVDLERLVREQPEGAPSAEGQELLLIGRRDPRTNNSWMHNSRRLVKGPARCTLLIHPDDARRRGITQGALVRVAARSGTVTLPAEVTDEVMPGVVSLPHGWGHHRPGLQLSVASAHPGVSVNDLTDEQRVDALCGNAALNGVPVIVRPGAPPDPSQFA